MSNVFKVKNLIVEESISLSGILVSTINNVVLNVGDQPISGLKTFQSATIKSGEANYFNSKYIKANTAKFNNAKMVSGNVDHLYVKTGFFIDLNINTGNFNKINSSSLYSTSISGSGASFENSLTNSGFFNTTISDNGYYKNLYSIDAYIPHLSGTTGMYNYLSGAKIISSFSSGNYVKMDTGYANNLLSTNSYSIYMTGRSGYIGELSGYKSNVILSTGILSQYKYEDSYFGQHIYSKGITGYYPELLYAKKSYHKEITGYTGTYFKLSGVYGNFARLSGTIAKIKYNSGDVSNYIYITGNTGVFRDLYADNLHVATTAVSSATYNWISGATAIFNNLSGTNAFFTSKPKVGGIKVALMTDLANSSNTLLACAKCQPYWASDTTITDSLYRTYFSGVSESFNIKRLYNLRYDNSEVSGDYATGYSNSYKVDFQFKNELLDKNYNVIVFRSPYNDVECNGVNKTISGFTLISPASIYDYGISLDIQVYKK